MSAKPAFVILSAFRADHPPDLNALRSRRLGAILRAHGAAIQEVRGSYKGTEEDAWLVLISPSLTLDTLVEIAAAYMQESVLYVTEDRTASLVFTDGEEPSVQLGFFKRVDPLTASRLDAWTYVDGAYYAARDWP